MNNFIPYEKLSKRERRARDAKRRVSWGMSPVTRRSKTPALTNEQRRRNGVQMRPFPRLFSFQISIINRKQAAFQGKLSIAGGGKIWYHNLPAKFVLFTSENAVLHR